MEFPNDVGVSLVDEEEDLLEYDNSMSSDDGQESTTEDDKNERIHVVSESEIRQAAEMILKQKLPKVLLKFNDDEFLLFECEDKEEVNEVKTIICEGSKGFSQSCNELFSSIRHFLETYYGKIAFVSKELLLELPCLDLTLCEDNVYNSQITFSDISTIFNVLKERSEHNSEVNVPSCIVGTITIRPRFVSRYNTLVELTQSSATLSNIKPFKNDETHPLVLDDNALPEKTPLDNQKREVVVMNLDEEGEAGERESEKRRIEEEEPESRLGESDSDELLEIVDNEEG
ncbi:RMR1 (YGL250W) [Zygosaccharomyces parabailii]|nr:RMR1 (YGL250W) [Zygosaccharomyces parabailii]CDH11804.1 uncharacterized protein ZBAI_03590 [Zygosaccharomyces bailii ISA1307]